jgi:hypothetical protein
MLRSRCLPPSLVNRLPLEDAVRIANGRFDNFFPSRVARDALVRDSASVVRLRLRLADEYRPASAQTVQVPKWGGATRPVLDMDVDDRVVYDALVGLVTSEIPEGAVHWTPSPAEREVREAEIGSGSARHVLTTDVDSCFETISHRRLEDDLRALTDDDEAAAAIVRLLGDVVGCDTGLPQGPRGSRILADIYLSAVDRSLARRGVEFVRFNDDYAVHCTSARDAARAREYLQELLVERGLGLNLRKTQVSTRERYAAGLRSRPPNQVVRELGEHPHRWGDSYEQSRPLVGALADLAKAGSPYAIGRVPALLSSFPHLTKQIARYLRAMIRCGQGENATAVVDDILRDRAFAFDWQLGWLYHSVLPATSHVPPRVTASARDSLLDETLPWFVRGRAAILLSTQADLPVAAMRAIVHDSFSANAPDFIAAVTNSPHGRDRSLILREVETQPLLAAVVELVKETGVQDL